jgi:protocatechuate 3,4-dioxygenase beta subunit
MRPSFGESEIVLYSSKGTMNKPPIEKTAAVKELSRREVLGLLAAGSAAAFLGGRRVRRLGEPTTGLALPATADAATSIPGCVVRPEQTEGPYFLDEKLKRSDIRSEPADSSVSQGERLRLAFQISRIDGSTCKPVSGAIVHVWQCDALGIYSGVRDMNGWFDTTGKKFLRGYQATNANGIVEFLTIYPGWYVGRAVHIHFKIRTRPDPGRAQEFTSQLYFDESVTDQVQKQAPYNSRGRRSTSNDADFIFRRGGKQLILTPTKDVQGYAAKFDIGLQMS